MKAVWDQLKQDEWEQFCDSAQAPMPQRWVYGSVHAALGGQVHRAVVWDQDTPVALCQCLSRKFAGVINAALAIRGPVWLRACDQKAALTRVRRSLPLPHPRVQVFSLQHPVQAFGVIPLMSPASFAQCNLPMKQSDLNGKWRNSLRKTGGQNIQIREETCSTTQLQSILETDLALQKLKAYQALPPEFTLNWQLEAPKTLRLFSAYEKGRVIAHALFIHHGNTATYHIAYTSSRARQISAGHRLIWQALQSLSAKGVCNVDLGILDTESAPGLARFKLGTGATVCRMGPTVLAL